MKYRHYIARLAVLFMVGLLVQPASVQAQSGNQECEAYGLILVAKFEWNGQYDFEKPSGNEDVVTLDGDAESVDWSSDEYISGIIVKGSNDSYFTEINPPALSGSFTNEGLEPVGSGNLPEISNVKFCVPNPDLCVDGPPTIEGPDILDEEERTITNTVLDGDGVKELRFTLLENVEVVSVTGDGTSYTSNAGGDVWTWAGSGDAPAEVTYVLHATSDTGRYFVVAEDECGTVTNFDPPFTLASGFTDRAALGDSYPNPFRTHTTVQFELSEQLHTTLTVYDVMGRRVATLVDQSMTPGPHEVVWNGRAGDGSTVASGIYFVRLEAGDRVQTQRVTIIK